MMNETSNSNATRSHKQQQQRIQHVADCSRAQDLNQNKLKQMFTNVLGSSMPNDEEDHKETPPKKILRTVGNTSQQDLTSYSIVNSSKNETPLPAPFPVSLSTSLAPTSASAVSPSARRAYTSLNTADQEVANAAADLMFINKGGHHTNSDSDANSIGHNNHLQQSLRESQEHTQYSPTSTSTDTSSPCQLAPAPEHALGMLKMDDLLHYITDHRTIIGRNSTTTQVHFHVANSSFVSRKHFQIDFEPDCGDFFLTCGSKNGIFVDDELQRCNTPPKKLPKACAFRFPSTYLLIHFESYTYHKYNSRRRREQINFQKDYTLQAGELKLTVPGDSDNYINEVSTTSCLSTSTDGSACTFTKKPSAQTNSGIFSTLKISIPNLEGHSDPYPSPTGTISAANSCPASPRHSFSDCQAFGNNDNRNNHNNDDPFRPPSAVSYNETEKPPYSYAQLIIQSISSAPDKQLTLSGIYTFISKNYPYYRMEANKGWQNSIRHNLSLNRYFIKVARSQDEPGKGSFWRIDPNSEAKLVDSSFKTRRQRSVVSFKRPSLQSMTHSAPVSPSHRDNSRESSPLQDLILQSAPGSPGMATAQEDSFDGQQGSAHPPVVQGTHDGRNNGSGQVCVEIAADNEHDKPNSLKAYSNTNASNIAQNAPQENQFKATNVPCTSFKTSNTLSNCHDVVVNYNSDFSCDQPSINQQFYFESQLKSEPIDSLEIKEEH